MLLNVTETLKQMNGQDILEVDEKGESIPATVRTACVNALLAPVDKEAGTEKVKKYDLAMRIYKEDKVELSAEECALIKEQSGKLFAPIVVGQLFNILDGKEALPS